MWWRTEILFSSVSMYKIFWYHQQYYGWYLLNNKLANFTVFSLGAFGYGLIEILWRGHTHWSMLTAGGFSFLGLCRIERLMHGASAVKKAFAGCVLITGIEYIFGVVFNIILKKNVWNYSKMPFNVNGQICALYSFFWLVLSFCFIPFAKIINRIFQGGNC